jgi:hypothetical protein
MPHERQGSHCASFDAKNSVFVDARLTLRLLPGVKQKWVDCHKGKSIKVGVPSLTPGFLGHSRSFCNARGSLLHERNNTDSYVSINFRSIRCDCHKERIFMNLEGENEFVSNLFFFYANDVNLQMLSQKLASKLAEAR